MAARLFCLHLLNYLTYLLNNIVVIMALKLQEFTRFVYKYSAHLYARIPLYCYFKGSTCTFINITIIHFQTSFNLPAFHNYPRCRTTVRKTFFSNRIIYEWNRLPQYVIDSSSVNVFKNRLDETWIDMGIYS